MKRNLITILSLVMSVMCNATSAFAQANAKANVPFAFNVGGFQLRAGTYEIKVLSKSPCKIMIENSVTRAAAVSITRPEGPRNGESKLVFNRVNNQIPPVRSLEGLGSRKHDRPDFQAGRGDEEGTEPR